MNDIDNSFIAHNVPRLLSSSTVPYIRSAQLRGTLFQQAEDHGAISAIFTDFPVDHEEPEAVLQVYKKLGKWRLGDLPERCEFVLVLPLRDRAI